VTFRFEFDRDPAKAATNFVEHCVTFDDAMTVFVDPLALPRLEDARGAAEERWVAVGLSRAINCPHVRGVR
jgi:uncharacterized protein